MPELDLGLVDRLDLSKPARSLDLTLAAHRMAAYLAWPNDENRRRQYLATLGATTLHGFESLRASRTADILPQPVREAENRVFSEVFLRHGGYGTVSEAPGMGRLKKLMGEDTRHWYVAGTVLCLIMTIHKHHSEIRRGGSVNKAVYLIEQHSEGRVRRNRKDLLASWAGSKPVAHLCAAIVHLRERAFHTNGNYSMRHLFGEGIGELLAAARHFQDFATTYTAHGQKGPLLKPSEIFMVPALLRLPRLVIDLTPLPPKQLVTLTNYRAPVPSQ